MDRLAFLRSPKMREKIVVRLVRKPRRTRSGRHSEADGSDLQNTLWLVGGSELRSWVCLKVSSRVRKYVPG